MPISRFMKLRFAIAAAALLLFAAATAPVAAPGKAEHIVVVVWDGMRPDFVTPEHVPTLAALARAGVFFKNNHPVFPSSTNVNGAALATGAYPQDNGIISNQEFRPEINPHWPFDTSDFPALDDRDGRINRNFITVPTIADLVQKSGHRTAIAGSKPVAQLFDRARRRQSQAARDSVVIYRGKFLPTSAAGAVTSVIGPFPKRKGFPNEREDTWTTRGLTDVLWKGGVPKFSLLWLSEPDLSQHETAPGSPTSLAAIKSSDANLAKVIAALKAKNALTSTDIFVVSDHGFSTVDLALDAAERLRAAGFDAVRHFPDAPKPGQVLVVSLGGSVEFYVIDHDPATIRRLVVYLQHSDFAGVILTRGAQEGTFTFAQLHLETPNAPDVLVASHWNDRPNEFGTPGQVSSDIGRKVGEGTHTTLSPFDMHNTLIASGPDFRRGWADETPSGNVDLAPTILSILGLGASKEMDGRILTEALAAAENAPTAVTHELKAERPLGATTWRQTLRLTTVGKTTYFVEGNGGPVSKQP
jgi:predicted AlkP superfamily pyrophosphatase or phosphodiesterase